MINEDESFVGQLLEETSEIASELCLIYIVFARQGRDDVLQRPLWADQVPAFGAYLIQPKVVAGGQVQ
ncbi:MAG: hypothetical protein NTX84_08110 [Nitrospirae bacterium]|nr:hypothetical protein [Nitrospirota bacterium]